MWKMKGKNTGLLSEVNRFLACFKNVKRIKLKHHLVALSCVLLKVAPNFLQFRTINLRACVCVCVYAYTCSEEKNMLFYLYARVGG